LAWWVGSELAKLAALSYTLAVPFVTRAGEQRIHYREFGSRTNPTLVLIQGLLLDGRFWFELPDSLANDPALPWHVLVPDNRGTGHSSLPNRPWTMADMADDVAAVLHAAGVEKAVIAGISMGGMIAQQVALRHAERVAGLLLMATWPGLPYGRLPPLRSIGDLVGSSIGQRRELDALARLVLPDSELGNARELLSGWVRLMREQAPPRKTFLGQFAAITTHSTGRRLGRIGVPVRVVAGMADRLVPPRNSEILAARIPGATLELLPGVGHAIPLLDRQVIHRNVALLRPSS
jgi:3-oxoadipate enol-lactonase